MPSSFLTINTEQEKTISMAATAMSADKKQYDGLKDIKAFHESKAGVKGLVDSGITSVPPFFIHPPESLSTIVPTYSNPNIVATVDFSGVDSDKRPVLVQQVARAARELGFFQIVNHGIPLKLMENMIGAINSFNEQPTEIKSRIYGRDFKRSVDFGPNIDLLKAATWRDTLRVRPSHSNFEPEEIPEICRNEVLEWDKEVKQVGEVLMGLLCEGLGLEKGKLKKMMFLEGRTIVGHYYPYCPQPDLTFGTISHTDPSVLTILLQDHVGGLQVKYNGEWVDVKPVLGALVINVGDILQILTNDEYKSVEHRVLANSYHEPRVSVAAFFNTSNRDDLYGPFEELVSADKPALYQPFVLSDFLKRLFTEELGGKPLKNQYRL
ncbi:1-aminocyclopropane-1-carboxylate oxidase homolog 1-like [Tripterygium wilfordii]|uniref:1-aminocyclopropane-1-carboxylate oxidase homolog 1-like n=1 Tax=Tripterygium wilfordii TaxID=458696 RepID=UPI0018F83F9A|nr:1-aminocyclopropane-1-carboxylate oxidase homolog 1-like [Tripterygium wilfordii]